jgi:hypothetical protein
MTALKDAGGSSGGGCTTVTVKAPSRGVQPKNLASQPYLKMVSLSVICFLICWFMGAGYFTLVFRGAKNAQDDTKHTTNNKITDNDIPNEYWTLTKDELADWLECEQYYKAGRPVHSQADWVTLRNAYRNVVGPEHSSLLPNDDLDGFGTVPVHAKMSDEKGRGVYALDTIPQGTLVWTSRHQSAQFTTGLQFRKFLASISVPMACDVLMWAYVHNIGTPERKKYRISCDLDAGSFINSAQFEGADHDETEANIGCIDEFDDDEMDDNLREHADSGCPENLFALRDIEPGEEILCRYGDFALKKGWRKFGL